MRKILHHIQTPTKRTKERGINMTNSARKRRRCQNYHRQGRLPKRKTLSGKAKVHLRRFCPN
eukprot:10401975-Karenia_brevis.AAC.1